MIFRTRFAPSPTGPLHLGHAFSALTAFELAKAHDGHFLLRIEDLDPHRSKPAWEAQIFDDLAWLGLSWADPVLRQSSHSDAYREALSDLWDRGLLYPCTCRRKDILAAATAPQEGAPLGPDGPIYPGTCRDAPRPARLSEVSSDAALRLDMALALAGIGSPGGFIETGDPTGETEATVTVTADEARSTLGDIVLSRRDFLGSYHLAVVLDDAAQEITHVVRGVDLFEATKIHVILQRLLGLPIPVYHHHRLIRDETGKRLAKRDDARAIAAYRADGKTPADVKRMTGLLPAARVLSRNPL